MTKELLEVFLKVQRELPVVKKDAQGFNYKFASLPHIWDKIEKIIGDNGFAVSHSVGAEGVTTTAYHEHGSLTSFIPFFSDGMKPQEVGSEITYYRRYNITAIFNIMVEGDDDDSQSSQDAKKTPRNVSNGKDSLVCQDCGKPLTMRKNGNGGYCSGKYPLTNPSCPPKKLSKDDQRISDEIDSWPEPIPTITIDDIK